MGSLISTPVNPLFISLGTLITRVQSFDLIFIQDTVVVDNYTKMNAQKAHLLRMMLRFKS